jgi:hypothetical protein
MNPTEWWRGHTRGQKVGATAVAALVGVGVWGGVTVNDVLSHRDQTCMNQRATIVMKDGPGGECVGLSAGDYDFDPSLHAVDQLILQENEGVADQKSKHYVSIVYLLPMSVGSGGVISTRTVEEQLEGAYTAQHYANSHDVGSTGTEPLIRILIGNGGNLWDGAAGILRDIEAEAGAANQHIVAVAGLGVSLTSTVSVVRQLTGGGLPVVGASATADDLDNIPGLVRITPSNSDEAKVVLAYIKATSASAAFVTDANLNDTYSQALGQDFAANYPDSSIVDTESYNTLNAADVVQNRISQMPANFCSTHARVVMFAGRSAQLTELLQALADSPCAPLTIVTGGDATNVTLDAKVEKALTHGVTVYYAGIAHPDEWGTNPGTPCGYQYQGYATFCGAYTQFPASSLADGNAMMGYDAILTAASAIRLAGPQPTPQGVIAELGALHGAHAVYGASGPIELSADYTSGLGSDPQHKPVPMLQLQPDGSPRLIQLEWPTGQPSLN